MSVVLEVENLHRRFDRRMAVEDLSLQMERGHILGLLGPNGAGKTTALRMIAGVLPPTGGRIALLGQPLDHRHPALKRHLGYLPDMPPLYETMRVAGYLHYCGRLRGLDRRQARKGVATVLEQCDLTGVSDRLIGNLSRGFRQRIGLAQALVHEPALLVLDEPTLGLDPIQMEGLRGLIAQLKADHAIIISTHLLPEVQALCDGVTILNEGRCVYSGGLDGGGEHGYHLMLRQPVPVDDLAGVPGVADVRGEGGRSFRLWLEAGAEPDRVLSLVLERGWGVAAWTPAWSQLETLFLEHVHGTGRAD